MEDKSKELEMMRKRIEKLEADYILIMDFQLRTSKRNLKYNLGILVAVTIGAAINILGILKSM